MIIALEFVEGLTLVRLDHIGDVLVGMHIADTRTLAVGQQGVANGMDKVCFAQSHAAIQKQRVVRHARILGNLQGSRTRSEEHTSELQSLMRISYAVFCLKKKKTTTN